MLSMGCTEHSFSDFNCEKRKNKNCNKFQKLKFRISIVKTTKIRFFRKVCRDTVNLLRFSAVFMQCTYGDFGQCCKCNIPSVFLFLHFGFIW